MAQEPCKREFFNFSRCDCLTLKSLSWTDNKVAFFDNKVAFFDNKVAFFDNKVAFFDNKVTFSRLT